MTANFQQALMEYLNICELMIGLPLVILVNSLACGLFLYQGYAAREKGFLSQQFWSFLWLREAYWGAAPCLME